MRPTAVVTGGARGLGRETASALFDAGYQLVISGRDKDSLVETAHSLDPSGELVLAVPADVRDEQAVNDLAAATLDPVRPHRRPRQQQRDRRADRAAVGNLAK